MNKILGTVLGISLLILISWFTLRVYTMTSLPGLKLKDDVYTVVNCEPPRDEHARLACPYLYCNKALLESGEIPANANISRAPGTTLNRFDGVISYTTKEHVDVRRRFQCDMQGDEVLGYQVSE